MTTLVNNKPLSIASSLHVIDTQMAQLEARREELRGQLLDSLKKQGVKSVHLVDGTTYVRAERTTLKAKSDAKAYVWAQDNNCLKVDTAKAYQIMRRSLDPMPKFFTKNTTEYLTIKRPNDKRDAGN